MNNKIKSLLGFFAFIVLIAAAYFAYNQLQYHQSADDLIHIPTQSGENLQRAPDIAVYDAYGNEVWLSDFHGRPVVLNFWATWCPSCGHESPYFETMYHEMRDEVELLKVVLLDGRRETHSSVDAFMVDNSYTFPLHFDTTGTASRSYGVAFIPMTFFITADGYIAATIQGAASEESLRSGVDIIR